MHSVLLIPGIDETPKSPFVSHISSLLRSLGFQIELFSYNKSTNILKTVDTLTHVFNSDSARVKLVLSHSFGSYLAFVASQNTTSSMDAHVAFDPSMHPTDVFKGLRNGVHSESAVLPQISQIVSGPEKKIYVGAKYGGEKITNYYFNVSSEPKKLYSLETDHNFSTNDIDEEIVTILASLIIE
jgi:hypothetical protein